MFLIVEVRIKCGTLILDTMRMFGELQLYTIKTFFGKVLMT